MGDMRGDCCHDHGGLDAKDGDEGGAGDGGTGKTGHGGGDEMENGHLHHAGLGGGDADGNGPVADTIRDEDQDRYGLQDEDGFGAEGGDGDKGDGEGERMAAESLPGINCGMRGCNSHCCVAEGMRLFLFYLLRVLGLVSVAPLWAVRLAGERFV